MVHSGTTVTKVQLPTVRPHIFCIINATHVGMLLCRHIYTLLHNHTKDIVASPQNYKGLFEDLVLMLKVELGSGWSKGWGCAFSRDGSRLQMGARKFKTSRTVLTTIERHVRVSECM